MNGPEHYAAAEQLLGKAQATAARIGWADDSSEYTNTLAAAQVHATLALTAATANAEHGKATSPLAERPSGWDGSSGDRATWHGVLA